MSDGVMKEEMRLPPNSLPGDLRKRFGFATGGHVHPDVEVSIGLIPHSHASSLPLHQENLLHNHALPLLSLRAFVRVGLCCQQLVRGGTMQLTQCPLKGPRANCTVPPAEEQWKTKDGDSRAYVAFSENTATRSQGAK
eukprot:Gb_41285 [translate_table: standard]